MRHILIVDDDPHVRTVLRRILRRSGFEVSEAREGSEALAMVNGRSIDLVILDLLMPGKGGLETLMTLRRDGKQTKVIAVSGGTKSAGTDYLPAAQKLGADAILKKPFRHGDLLDAIDALL